MNRVPKTAEVITLRPGHPPPHDRDAERAVLGAIFIKPWAYDEVAASLDADDFLLAEHREVFGSMSTLALSGKPIDPVTVAEDLRRRGQLARLDGQESYLAALGHEVPTANNVGHYTRIVREKASLRRLIATCAEVQTRAGGDFGDFDEFVTQSERQLVDVTRAAVARHDVQTDAAALALTVWAQPLPPAVSTGIAPLDLLLKGGLRAQSLGLLAGGTGSGKTGLAIQISRHIARTRTVTYFSTEIGARQLLARAAAPLLRRPWEEVFGDPDCGPLVAEAVAQLRLAFVEVGPTTDVLRVLDQVAQRTGEAPVCVLDYLQDFARRSNPEDRRIATAAVTDSLKQWARTSSSLALVLSSVGRGFYTGNENRTAAEFKAAPKESGDVEFDAAAVMFLDTEPATTSGPESTARLHLSKNRFGRIGTVGLVFDGALGTFRSDPFGGLSGDQAEALDAIREGATTTDDVRKVVGRRKADVLHTIAALRGRGLVSAAPYRVLP